MLPKHIVARQIDAIQNKLYSLEIETRWLNSNAHELCEMSNKGHEVEFGKQPEGPQRVNGNFTKVASDGLLETIKSAREFTSMLQSHFYENNGKQD